MLAGASPGRGGSPGVEQAERRKVMAKYKLEILEQADAAPSRGDRRGAPTGCTRRT